jgi:hypothetical protein
MTPDPILDHVTYLVGMWSMASNIYQRFTVKYVRPDIDVMEDGRTRGKGYLE